MSLLFVSVVREGLSTRLATEDTGASSPLLTDKPIDPALTLKVSATVGSAASNQVSMHMLGPADVAGLDPRVVLRTDPPAGAQAFDPSLFAVIEFDVPGLPWMFTPLATSGNRLRPWLALVALPIASDGQSPLDVEPLRHGRLPVLTVNSLDELPPIDDTWAWAHAQFATVAGTVTPSDLTALVRNHPEATLSRLLCPRKLEERTHYVACVVPTFEAGRTGGLEDPPDQTLNPAWSATATFPLRLPVYYSWEFFTGEARNFEQAVRQLRRADAPAKTGRVLDASDPGPDGVRDAGAAALPLAGALRPEGLQISSYTGPAVAGYEQLAQLGEVVTSPSGQPYPVVNVPLYAGKHVGARTVAAAPSWVRELNTDPRHRVAAALGARIVRDNQEALMRSAWEQAGEIEEINRRLRRARLGRAASARVVKRHITPLADVTRLGVLASGFARLALSGVNRTLAALVAGSRIPDLALSSSYTALTRPGGRIGRRFASIPDAVTGVVSGIEAGTVDPDRGGMARPGEIVSLDGVLEVIREARPGTRGGGRLREPRRVTEIDIADAGDVGGPAGEPLTLKGPFAIPLAGTMAKIGVSKLSPRVIADLPGQVFLAVGEGKANVTAAHKSALAEMFKGLEPETPSSQPPLDIAGIATQALSAVQPESMIVRAVSSRITIPDRAPNVDPLDDVLAAPRFDAALSVDLMRIAPDMLLPGVDDVRPDRVFGVVSNNAFVQALLAGANHEMMRELRWRGFPTDERGTSFHRFWRADIDEIPDLHTIRAGALGAAVSGGVSDVVVVIRSSLLSRFPGTQVFAVPGDSTSGQLKPVFDRPELPIFRGQLAPDVSFFGFAFSEHTATASPGRYLVFQQPAGAPSFGLDLGGSGGFPANASDLGWGHVPMTGPYVKVDRRTTAFADNGAIWGDTAADQALSTLQQPVRAAIHFRKLLGPP